MGNMAAQTSYGFGFPKGVVGGIYDLSHHEVETRQAEGKLVFGVGVVKGTNAGIDVKLPTAGTQREDFEGITVRDSVMVEQEMNGSVSVGDKSTIGVMTEGKIWAGLSDDVKTEPAYGSTAYLIISGNEAGLFTTAAGNSGTTVDVGVKFGKTSDVPNHIAVVVLK